MTTFRRVELSGRSLTLSQHWQYILKMILSDQKKILVTFSTYNTDKKHGVVLPLLKWSLPWENTEYAVVNMT